MQLQNRSFQVDDWKNKKQQKKKHREMFLIKEMQNCVFSSLNMQFFYVPVSLAVMVTLISSS